MKIFSTIILAIIAVVCCQGQSSVVLSGLKVAEVVNPSANALDNFMIELTISDPLSLNSIEVVSEDKNNPGNDVSVTFLVNVVDNVAQLVSGHYTQPFQGNVVHFLVPVKDQFVSPYHRVLVKGYDLHEVGTNQLVYNRIK